MDKLISLFSPSAFIRVKGPKAKKLKKRINKKLKRKALFHRIAVNFAAHRDINHARIMRSKKHKKLYIMIPSAL